MPDVEHPADAEDAEDATDADAEDATDAEDAEDDDDRSADYDGDGNEITRDEHGRGFVEGSEEPL